MKGHTYVISRSGHLSLANKVAQLKKENLSELFTSHSTGHVQLFLLSIDFRFPFHPFFPSKDVRNKKRIATYHYLLCLILHQRHQHVAF